MSTQRTPIELPKQQSLKEVHRTRPGILGILALMCGAVGIGCALTTFFWAASSLVFLDLDSPVLASRQTLVTFFQLGTVAFVCGVLATALGGVHSARAHEKGERPSRLGRIGLFLGIASLVMLAMTFLVSVLLALNALVRDNEGYALSEVLPISVMQVQ